MPMATIYIPPSLQTLTDGLEKVELEALRVSDAVQVLEQRFPGIESRLCEGDQLSPGLQVSVDGSLRGLGLLCRLNQLKLLLKLFSEGQQCVLQQNISRALCRPAGSHLLLPEL